jgi:hypothetical protein
MLAGALPHEHGVHIHNPDFSAMADNSVLTDLPNHVTISVSANRFTSSEFNFDTLQFDQYIEPDHFKVSAEGLNPTDVVTDTDKQLRDYLTFLRAALRSDHPIGTLRNGVYGFAHAKVDDWTDRRGVPKITDNGTRAYINHAQRAVSRTDRPFFLFQSFMDAHQPHRHALHYDRKRHGVPIAWSSDEMVSNGHDKIEEIIAKEGPDAISDTERYDETELEYFKRLYVEAIDYLDRRLADHVKYLLEETERETTVFVTADHGEALGSSAESYLLTHGKGMTESELHVPMLVVNPPDWLSTPEDYFSHADLRSLLVACARDRPETFGRETIAAERIGTRASGYDTEEAVRWASRMIRCMYNGTQNYVWDSMGRQHVYELRRDKPCWQRLVSQDMTLPKAEKSFFAVELDEFKQSAEQSGLRADEPLPDMDPAVVQRLENLGYK